MIIRELPELSDYSASDLAAAGQAAPAIERYLRQIQSHRATQEHEKLRVQRHKMWLRSSLAVHFRRASAEEVCRWWSQSAEKLLSQAWNMSGAPAEGLTLIAMGKLGSTELNLSSDVDLMLISPVPAETNAHRCLKLFRSALADSTDHGFCLRVDLDLRPGGRLGPLISSRNQFEDYYWSQGSTWERLAFVRSRILFGPQQIREDLADVIQRFVYRKYTDFSVFEDLKQLRQMIFGRPEQDDGTRLNLKFHRGGIRDIELYIHAQQVIHGGKDLSLRSFSTSAAISALEQKGKLSAKEAKLLFESYWLYRDLENHVQIKEDRQTYLWAPEDASPVNLTELRDRMSEVEKLVNGLLGQGTESGPKIPHGPDEQIQWLTGLGFEREFIQQTWPEVMRLTVHSKSSQRDELARQQFIHSFFEELHRCSGDRELAVRLLIDFIRGTRAKATFYSLLNREPRLIRDLALLFSSSPYLGSVLASRPEILDSFLFRSQDAASSDFQEQLEGMAERRLLAELMAAIEILRKSQGESIYSNLSLVADEIVVSLLEALEKHEQIQGLGVVALGKWGGRELGFRSDLDLILITEQAPELAHFKMAKRFISRLTEQHRGGSIYGVDLRLRPSGSAGPLIVARDALVRYLEEQAAPWERQAYLRARILKSAPLPLGESAVKRGLTEDDLEQLKDIRQKLLRPIQEDEIDLKYAPGGLVDLEFAVQTALLEKKIAPSDSSTVAMLGDLAKNDSEWQSAGKRLIRNFDKIRHLEQLLRLTGQSPTTVLHKTSELSQRVARIMNTDSINLDESVRALLSENQTFLKHLDPISSDR